jgi:hypothetical protein
MVFNRVIHVYLFSFRCMVYIYNRLYESGLIIKFECTFHEYLPDDDPAGSKHVANVHNKQILIQ